MRDPTCKLNGGGWLTEQRCVHVWCIVLHFMGHQGVAASEFVASWQLQLGRIIEHMSYM